eukprot:gene16948-32123_t
MVIGGTPRLEMAASAGVFDKRVKGTPPPRDEKDVDLQQKRPQPSLDKRERALPVLPLEQQGP